MANNLKAPSNMRRCVKFSFYIQSCGSFKSGQNREFKVFHYTLPRQFFCSDGAIHLSGMNPSTFISKLKKLDIEY